MNKYILSGVLSISLILSGGVLAHIGGEAALFQENQENQINSAHSGENVDYNHTRNDEQSNKNNGMPGDPGVSTGALKNNTGPVNRSQATDY